MKRSVLVLIVFLVALPLSADVIVTGGAHAYNSAGTAWVNISLPMLCGSPGMYSTSLAHASLDLNSNTYSGNEEAFSSCLYLFPGDTGVRKIEWEGYFGGEIPVPVTIFYDEFVSAHWTTVDTVFGYYYWFDGRPTSEANDIKYGFRGPAEYDFYVFGTLTDPQIEMFVTFSVTARPPISEIPEPSTLLLVGIGLAGVCCHKRR